MGVMGGGEAAPFLSPSAGGGQSCSSSSPNGNGKRARDPEDELYLDNYHNHKRYLSQMMATSLNGLTVGDSLGENLMESPARSDSISYLRDEIFSPYSPMSEDSDDVRYCDTPTPSSPLPDFASRPTSPVSPQRHQKHIFGLSTNPYPLPGCTLPAVVCSHSRQRGSETDGRFPSSPSDVCHSADLRRAALLRSVQMRTKPHCSAAYELPFDGNQENNHCVEEVDDRPFSEMKTLVVHEADCEGPVEEVHSMLTEYSSDDGSSKERPHCEKKCYDVKYGSIDR